jgi:hypothetical protein
MDRATLWKNIKGFYRQYVLIKSHPNLWKGSQVGLTALCNALFNILPSSTTFSRRALKAWERKKTLQYSIPNVEWKAIELFERAMPQCRKYKMKHIPTINNDEVYAADKETIGRYRRMKGLDFSQIDVAKLDAARTHIDDSLFVGSQEMLTFEEALYSLPKDTSSCYPMFEKKSSERAIRDARIKLDKLLSFSNLLDVLNFMNTQLVVVFHRFTTRLKRSDENPQSKKTRITRKTKIRQVFGVPFLIAIIETMMFGKALKQICKPNRFGFFSYSLTRPEISLQVSTIRAEAMKRNSFILCGDISKIDSNITPLCLYWVYEFLIRHVTLNEKWQRIYLSYLLWIIFTPIAWASRTIDWTLGGNITGSFTTSFVNSYTLLLVINYFFNKVYNRDVNPNELKILGDDFILLIDDPTVVGRLSHVLGYFNLRLNTDKQHIVYNDENITYLGFDWNINHEPENEDLWYLARICFPERFLYVRGYERIIQRSASILYQIKGGGDIFNLVFYNQIGWFRKLLKSGIDPLIQYLDKSGSLFYVKIPYSILNRIGWRAF